MNKNGTEYEAVVMGASVGGMNALGAILPLLPEDFPLPIIIVQHTHVLDLSEIPKFLNKLDLKGVHL